MYYLLNLPNMTWQQNMHATLFITRPKLNYIEILEAHPMDFEASNPLKKKKNLSMACASLNWTEDVKICVTY